jgi:hypothetical protein
VKKKILRGKKRETIERLKGGKKKKRKKCREKAKREKITLGRSRTKANKERQKRQAEKVKKKEKEREKKRRSKSKEEQRRKEKKTSKKKYHCCKTDRHSQAWPSGIPHDNIWLQCGGCGLYGLCFFHIRKEVQLILLCNHAEK